jgi:hypothetical protein
MRALAALLPLVHAEFALAELDYFHGVTQSPQNASLAYDTYSWAMPRGSTPAKDSACSRICRSRRCAGAERARLRGNQAAR